MLILKCGLLIFTFLLISVKILAQQQPYQYNVKVAYKLTFQPDSTDQKSIQNEFETLLIGKEQSLFCPSNYLIIDSAITSEAAKGNTFGPPMSFFVSNRIKNRYIIFKSSAQIITFDIASRFDQTFYKYEEPKTKFNWKIFSDTLSIGGITCQKAEINFGNRMWIAWFAPSIPISDGPYKFCGLPGLILEIYDEQHYWNFNLASLTKVDTTLKINFSNKIPKPIGSKAKFFTLKLHDRNNMFELLEMQDGVRYSNKEAVIKHFKELAKKDNNWIELYKGDSK